MARRMDVELTSDRGDGSWTWRAAGARQPRGVVDASLVGSGAHVGDVLRVEAEIELDGITITAVLPQRVATPRQGLIEISGSGHPGPAGVTTSLLPHRERRPGSRPGERTRPDEQRSRPGGDDRRPDRRSAGPRPDEREHRSAPRSDGPKSGAPTRPHPGPGVTGGGTAPTSGRSSPRPARPAGVGATERARRSRPPRLSPGNAHRDALLDSLPVEQRPIAEQLAIGGLPAVRRALAEERAAATAQGLPGAAGDAIVTLAEQLLPAVREATWLDRAEAAERIIDEISLRDLRAAVAGAAPRDEHGRELLRQLRQALEQRITRLREAWERDMTHALEENRVLQALRLSARPPEPNTRFPAALVNRLAEAGGAAMTATTSVERWLALLEAASASPVRRLVKPAGVPEDAGLRKAAAQAAGRIPALAPLLGLSMPPPPRPIPPPAARRVTAPLPGQVPGRRRQAEQEMVVLPTRPQESAPGQAGGPEGEAVAVQPGEPVAVQPGEPVAGGGSTGSAREHPGAPGADSPATGGSDQAEPPHPA